MCQPRRPSPAQRQAETQRDVARIGCALQDALDEQGVELTLVMCETAVKELLHRDLIRVSPRPEVGEPMSGQTTIDEMLDANWDERSLQ